MRLKTAYMALCVLGVLLPYWQFAPWLWEHGPDLPLFFSQLFENRVAAFFGVDVFVSAAALLVFALSEGRRTGVCAVWPVALAVVTVGVSLGLPLFLYLRERSPERGG